MEDSTTHRIRPNGTTFRYQERKYYIIGHYIDENRGKSTLIYLVKFYGKYYQWWHYEVMLASAFERNVDYGLIKQIKEK